ncbi:g1388 [Coccomyxa viridis]|uniref:G1388 protein n=1 Tax=Coccomyxa viridis TaxID=1274662 RepID=A0ABP1FPR2_9CHLO
MNGRVIAFLSRFVGRQAETSTSGRNTIPSFPSLVTDGGPPTCKDFTSWYAAQLTRKLQKPDPYAFRWSWTGQSARGGEIPKGKPMYYFAFGGVLGAGLGAAGYAGIANLKMRDLESSMLQLWKQHVGADFSVFAALSAAQPMKSLQGLWERQHDVASTSGRIAQRGPLSLGPHSLADAAARAAPAVVHVGVGSPNGHAHNGLSSSGSGLILDPDGTILTSAQIVSAAAETRRGVNGRMQQPKVLITLQDRRVYQGRVISSDRATDLAIVKVDSTEPLPCAQLGTSAGLRVGEWVLALGSPLHLHNSVTAGIVSCVDRKAVELGLAGPNTEYIQTDAATNSGNSGGPLVNLDGEVVGISSMKAVVADGVSFAIPIDTAKHIASQLQSHGRVVKPYIGIKMLQLDAGKAEQLKRADASFPAVRTGILVPEVSQGSPAHRAGLQSGDVIVGYGSEREPTTSRLIMALAEQVGKPLELHIMRPGSSQQVVISVTAVEAAS